jgi:hypothetical protein
MPALFDSTSPYDTNNDLDGLLQRVLLSLYEMALGLAFLRPVGQFIAAEVHGNFIRYLKPLYFYYGLC